MIKEQSNINQSNLVMIFIFDKLWGFIGFDECRFEREWTQTEAATLTTVANTLGIAINQNKKGQLEISVSDTGIGIAPEIYSKIVQPLSTRGARLYKIF